MTTGICAVRAVCTTPELAGIQSITMLRQAIGSIFGCRNARMRGSLESNGSSWKYAAMTAMSDKAKFAIAAILASVAFVAAAATARFPGAGELRSPDRRWAIVSEPPTADEGHRLLLKNLSDGTSRTLLSFPRHAEVAWAPSSKNLAVTNNFGSDSSDCLIFSVEGRELLSALEILSQSSLKKVVVGNHHVYIKCGSWKDSVAVDVEIDAYGDNDPNGKKVRTRIDVKKRAILPRATQ